MNARFMNMRLVTLAVFPLISFLACQALAAPDIEIVQGRQTERTRIEAERTAANVKFDAQDAECQTRFVVTSCRNNVRIDRLRLLDALKREEAVLNKLDRQAAAAKQLKKLDDKVR